MHRDSIEDKIIHPLPGRGGGHTHVIHGRSRMTIDPRIPTMPGRNTSGFPSPERHCMHAPSVKRREVPGESYEGRAASYYEPIVRRAFSHKDDSVEWIDLCSGVATPGGGGGDT